MFRYVGIYIQCDGLETLLQRNNYAKLQKYILQEYWCSTWLIQFNYADRIFYVLLCSAFLESAVFLLVKWNMFDVLNWQCQCFPVFMISLGKTQHQFFGSYLVVYKIEKCFRIACNHAIQDGPPCTPASRWMWWECGVYEEMMEIIC